MAALKKAKATEPTPRDVLATAVERFLEAERTVDRLSEERVAAEDERREAGRLMMEAEDALAKLRDGYSVNTSIPTESVRDAEALVADRKLARNRAIDAANLLDRPLAHARNEFEMAEAEARRAAKAVLTTETLSELGDILRTSMAKIIVVAAAFRFVDDNRSSISFDVEADDDDAAVLAENIEMLEEGDDPRAAKAMEPLASYVETLMRDPHATLNIREVLADG